MVGNHHPIFPALPYGFEPDSPAIVKTRVECMGEKTWAERNRALSEAQEKRGEAARDHLRRGNVTMATRGLQDLINSALERLTRKINKDGWERFLAAIQPADATLLYKIAREKDRRESEAVTCPCAAPSLHADVWYTGTTRNSGAAGRNRRGAVTE